MKIKRLISLILMVTLMVGCAPVLERATMPADVDKIIKMRISKSKSVLIFAIWRKVPFIYDGLKASTYLISRPIITSGKEITSAYKSLPRPLNYGLVGPACQVGSELVLQGIYIIVDNGEIIWLQHNVTPSDPDWSIIKSSIIGPNWKNAIANDLRNGKSIELQTNSNDNVWGAFDGNYERMTCLIVLDQNEQKMIIDFISKVPAGNFQKSEWAITSKR